MTTNTANTNLKIPSEDFFADLIHKLMTNFLKFAGISAIFSFAILFGTHSYLASKGLTSETGVPATPEAELVMGAAGTIMETFIYCLAAFFLFVFILELYRLRRAKRSMTQPLGTGYQVQATDSLS
ncbi:hypothetical protein ACN08Y_09905 [Rothia sp. P5764]|uniref:hypothetical protein n=1 Tax=Rothia sp. P5764 TaxID=3402654 RepID=UPI003ACB2FB0